MGSYANGRWSSWNFNFWLVYEAHFSFSESVNTRYCRIWTRDNLYSIAEKPLHNVKVTSAVLSRHSSSVLFFFEEMSGDKFRTDPVTGYTVGSKIIRTLAIIFVILFSGLIASFYHLMLVLNSIEPKYLWLYKYLFHKTALDMSFLTRTIYSARIILLPNVDGVRMTEKVFRGIN